jgi:hypothetical protein
MSILFHGARSPRSAAAAVLAAMTLLLSATGGITPAATPDAVPSARAALAVTRSCQPATAKTSCRKLRARQRFLQTHV